MHHVHYTVGRPLYEIAVEGEEPIVASAEALLDAWGERILIWLHACSILLLTRA